MATDTGEVKVEIPRDREGSIYFEVPVSAAAFERLVLHEGAAFEAVDGRELLMRRRVTPYDAFAIWLHLSRHRLMGT